MSFTVVLSFIGGLGLFLYGMRMTMGAIETVAGAKLRQILGFFTTNRFTGMAVGFVFAAIIQSSSVIMVNAIIRYAVEVFTDSDETHLEDVKRLEEAVDEKERELQEAHVKRLSRGDCTPEAGMIFSDIVSGLERVADHATNIAFATTEEA